MPVKKKFDFLEHTADAYIAAYGQDLSEAFENAAIAMFEVITDVEKVSVELKETVEVVAYDVYALLYNWLETLLVKFEITGIVYSKFVVRYLNQNVDDIHLKAEIGGEKFNAEKHTQKVGVKAITYHRMEIIRNPDRVTLKFILDI